MLGGNSFMKYRYLSVIFLILVLSIGAVCAQQDASDVIATNSNDVLSVDNDVNILENEISSGSSVSIENDAILKNANISDNDKLAGNINDNVFEKNSAYDSEMTNGLLSGNLSTEVTNSTFFSVFNETGHLRDNITADNLIFAGEFSNLVDIIFINRPISLLGDNATLYNMGFEIRSDNVTVDKFIFHSDCLSELICIHEANNVSIFLCDFIVQGLADDNNTVIDIIDSYNNLIDLNRFSFSVNSNGTYKNTLIHAKDSEGLIISNNQINASLPSRGIDWSAGVAYSEGICLDDCDNAIFDGNIVNVISNNKTGEYDTIYAVHITGDNASIIDSKMDVIGAPYGYALVIAGEDLFIHNNNLSVENGTYGCAINVESNSNGLIDENIIDIIGDSAYGIYTANWGGDVKANINNNIISLNGNTLFGMSLSGSEFLVANNSVFTNGNYTTGIASVVDDIIINNNTINANGSNVGTPAGYDVMGIETTGIHIVSGDVIATNNNVITTGEFTVDLKGTGEVTDNYLVASQYTGDASVNYTLSQSVIVKNNTPAMQRTVISAENVVMYYRNGTRYVVVLTDQNGQPLYNKTVTFNINGASYNRTTDENGTTSLAINLNSGNYTAYVLFAGDDVYSNSTIENNITVLTTVVGQDLVKVFRNGTQYYATFINGLGSPIVDADVKFNINGVMYIRKTNELGQAQLNINLPQGTYIITAINPVNGEMHANNITVLPTIANNTDLVKYYKNESQYVVTLIGNDGNPVGAGEVVTFNINGVFYIRQTNESGQAQLNINLPQGDYIITAEYKGCMVSNNITVLPILRANDLVKKYGVSDQFIAYLVDGQGNPYPNQEVFLNLHGIVYSRITDYDGRAILNIKADAAVDTYIVSTTYNDCTIVNTITVVP